MDSPSLSALGPRPALRPARPVGHVPGPGLFGWVPIRSLAARHRARIVAHLRRLAPRDRYLRFGQATSDAQIQRYVDGIDFERDEVFGVFNRRLELIAMAHLAVEPSTAAARRVRMAEFGVSVLDTARGRGYGARLFAHAVLHARNRGIATLFIHALSENTAMLKIARRAGATVERDGSESEAFLKLPGDTLVTQLSEVVESQAAEMNYQLKRHALRLEQLLSAVGEVKNHLGQRKQRGTASE